MIYAELTEDKTKEIDKLMDQYIQNYTGDNMEVDCETHRERLILLFRSTNTTLLKDNIKEERISTAKAILSNVEETLNKKKLCESIIKELELDEHIARSFKRLESMSSMKMDEYADLEMPIADDYAYDIMDCIDEDYDEYFDGGPELLE